MSKWNLHPNFIHLGEIKNGDLYEEKVSYKSLSGKVFSGAVVREAKRLTSPKLLEEMKAIDATIVKEYHEKIWRLLATETSACKHHRTHKQRMLAIIAIKDAVKKTTRNAPLSCTIALDLYNFVWKAYELNPRTFKKEFYQYAN